MKATLKNTTVNFTAKRNLFIVKKGKGTGSQIASFETMQECLKFDLEFNNLEYKHITQVSTGKIGGAYFYKGTENMFSDNHPYLGDFKIN